MNAVIPMPADWQSCDLCTDPAACWAGNTPCELTGAIRDRPAQEWVSPPELAHRIHWRNQERIPIWTVYRPCPEAHPTQWTVRLFFILPQVTATLFVFGAASLDELRAGLPMGLYRLGREACDAPEIVENWL